MQETSYDEFPYGLAVRIPGFHPGGPGSTPGMGKAVLVFTAIFDDDDGNFICVFECTIVNLATYRQFTNAA